MDFSRNAAGAVFPDRPLKKAARELFAARVKCGAHFDRGLASKLPTTGETQASSFTIYRPAFYVPVSPSSSPMNSN
jgi:hypothetical protein